MSIIKYFPVALMILAGCNHVEIPKYKHYQFYTNARVYVENDTIYFYLNNPVKCPLRYYISSSDSSFNKKLTNFKPITLQQKKDTVLKIAGDSGIIKTITYPNFLGDVNQKITKNNISLPFPKGRHYNVIQGYNGKHSHNMDKYSRYAIDFNLKKNDTICAADSGVVVGVIKDYSYGGDDKRLLLHANLITIYHPHSGLFTQYCHLVHDGSLVALGNKVQLGQPIGLSGETGFTDTEHLHFNVLVPVPTDEGLNSVKISFIEGYEGEKLTKNARVRK
jgi:murein DD-endopeptidase MepM/ murein hydrolase activator NlpD